MKQTPSPDEHALRTFVAVQVPADIQTELGSVAVNLRKQLPEKSVRWVRPENIHLTLRFIGDVSPRHVADLKGALGNAADGIEPFTLELSQPGCFPSRGSPRVLWVGLEGDIERLSRLQSSVAEATRQWGKTEDREFHPHLTLGRVLTNRRGELEQVVDIIHEAAVAQCAPWPVTAMHLMQSVLTPNGSRYSTLATVLLSG